MLEWLRCHETIASWLRAIGTIIAAVTATGAFWSSRRSVKREIVNNLFGEYGKDEMGIAVSNLHREFRRITQYRDDQDKPTPVQIDAWISYYSDNLRANERWPLHLDRRKVSVFYQRIADFSWGHLYVTKMVRRMWGEDLMMRSILIPIETVAIPEALEILPCPTIDKYPPRWRIFWEFWTGRPRCGPSCWFFEVTHGLRGKARKQHDLRGKK